LSFTFCSRPSDITHGSDVWYDLEIVISPPIGSETVGRAYYVVDAFADPTCFGTGNPAAVVPLERAPNDQDVWMQTVAQEFNLSETAFLWKIEDAESSEESNGAASQHYGIRYFTPTIEVDLCGHATLASAAVLCEMQQDKSCQNIVFHAPKNVVLKASQIPESSTKVPRVSRIAMFFPTAQVTPISDPEFCRKIELMLLEAFAISKESIVFMGLAEGLGDLLIEVHRDAFLDDPEPPCFNVHALLNWDGYERGVMICCLGDEVTLEGAERMDFCSRFFAPFAGIMEDPVTGSAHCALAPYFGAKLEKRNLIGKQLSPRGGIVACELSEDLQQVCLTGMAVTTASGSLWM
jgi:PhzF family phenazine biosynthesis protein